MTTLPAPASTRIAELLRWGGWWVVIVCALVRCLVTSDPFPYWGIDPGQTILPITGLTPAASMSVDAVMLLACGVALLGEVLAGFAVLWIPMLLWALGCAGVAVQALAIRAGTIDDARIGATWCAAMAAGLVAMHVCRDERFRRVTLAAMVGVIAMLAAKGAVQVFYEHAMTVASYRRDRAAFLHSQGWSLDSASARNFERRLNQPEATGWFGLSNVYATFAAACSTALLGCVVLAWREARATRRMPDGWAGVLSLGLLAAIGAMLLAGSKGGFAAGAVGLSVLGGLAMLAHSRRSGNLKAHHLGMAAVALVLCAIVAVIVRGLMGESLGERSLLFRWFYMQGSVRAWAENPVFGTGPDGFKDAYMRLKPPLSPEEVSSPHSVLFDFAARIGIFGVLWAGLWVSWVYGIGRRFKVEPDGAAKEARASRAEAWLVLLAAAVPVLVSTWVERSMGSPEQAAARLAGLAGWIGISLALLILFRCGRAAGVVAAVGALVVAVHGQIEVTPLWESSAAWVCVMLGAAGAGAAIPSVRVTRALVAPGLLVAVAIGAAWLCVAPTSRWESSLSEAAAQVRPMAEIRTRLNTLAADQATEESQEAIFRDLARVAGVAVPSSQVELNRAMAALAHKTTTAALIHLEDAALRAPRHLATREVLVRTWMERAAAADFIGEYADAQVATNAALAHANDLVRKRPTAGSWGLLGNVEFGVYGATRDAARADEALRAWEAGAKLDPHGISFPLQAFRATMALGRTAAAKELAERLLRLNELSRLDPLKQLSEEDLAAVKRAAGAP